MSVLWPAPGPGAPWYGSHEAVEAGQHLTEGIKGVGRSVVTGVTGVAGYGSLVVSLLVLVLLLQVVGRVWRVLAALWR